MARPHYNLDAWKRAMILARAGRKEFAQFLNVAKGSLSELETQLLISAELGYLDVKHAVFEMLEEVSRLLAGLHRSVLR